MTYARPCPVCGEAPDHNHVSPIGGAEMSESRPVFTFWTPYESIIGSGPGHATVRQDAAIRLVAAEAAGALTKLPRVRRRWDSSAWMQLHVTIEGAREVLADLVLASHVGIATAALRIVGLLETEGQVVGVHASKVETLSTLPRMLVELTAA